MHHNKRLSQRLNRVVPLVALVVTALVGVTHVAPARAAAPATYTVFVGSDTPYGLELLGFNPQTLKVHRGDTVTWKFLGFHNVHFASEPIDFGIQSQINGKAALEVNPAAALPNFKSGDRYKDGDNTGLPSATDGSLSISLVMDVAPGTYGYLCDVHPGMLGTIIVVDDSTDIPSPADVEKDGQTAIQTALASADQTYLNLTKTDLSVVKDGNLNISMGGNDGTVAIDRSFPVSAQITAGQSVTWNVPDGFNLHTINIPLPTDGFGEPFTVVPDAAGQPHFVFTPAMLPTVKSGDSLPDNSTATSGLLGPGQSFTLKFPKPGVYPYYCAVHPGHLGVITVVPAQAATATP